MRIVGRKEFLSLPRGTVYSRFEPIVTEGLEIKLDTLDSGNDWFYLSFIGAVEIISRGDDVDSFYKMMAGGELSIEPFSIRDGGFEEDEQFLIYSDDDVEAIIVLLQSRKE
jgi:hypothetical protein